MAGSILGTGYTCSSGVQVAPGSQWWSFGRDFQQGQGCAVGRGRDKSRCCEDMLVSKRFRNAVMLCHLPWAYRHSHPPYSPSGGWWPQRPLPSGAFTALLPRAHPSHSTSFWSSCACPCSLCLSVPGACEMSHLTLVIVEPLACFSGGSSVQGEGMLSILSGLHQERLRLHLGLDAAPCLAAGETASHLARVPRRELPGAWVKTRPEALCACV